MRIHVALLLVPVLLVACGNDSPTAPEGVSVSFETVVKTSYSGFKAPARTSVRRADEWAEVWQTLHSGLSPIPALPAVDFNREMLVLAALGTRSNGCFEIEITRATLKGSGEIEFAVTETFPGRTCVCTLAMTQPVHVVKVELMSGPERFVERRKELRC